MKYYHVIRNRKRSALGLTLAMEITPQVGQARFDVLCGVSYCAPVERTFSRPLGRRIAANRLRSNQLLPFHKRFKFSLKDLHLLKATALSMLMAQCPIGWAVALAEKEMDDMTARWMRRHAVAALPSMPEAPKRLAAKSVPRARYKVDRSPHKQEIVARLKDGQSARSIARMLRTRGNPISYTTIARHRPRLLLAASS